jgi:hypothetical protein
MLEISLFFLFSFLALAIFAVGKFTNSTLIMFIGGLGCLFTGLMVLPSGLGQYDGTYNASYTYSCSNCGNNATMTTQTEIPNFYIINSLWNTTLGILDVLLGLVMGYYYYVGISRPVRE